MAASAPRILITNNWSLTIPAGTVYSYRVSRKGYSYRSPGALGPGQTLNIAGPYNATSCDVSAPG